MKSVIASRAKLFNGIKNSGGKRTDAIGGFSHLSYVVYVGKGLTELFCLLTKHRFRL